MKVMIGADQIVFISDLLTVKNFPYRNRRCVGCGGVKSVVILNLIDWIAFRFFRTMVDISGSAQ